MDSEIFEKMPPTKLFFRLAIPSMITMAFGALYQIADGLFVGRFIGEDALAAVNLIMPIIMIVFGFANLIATGASVRISILLGEKNREVASQVFTFTLKVIFFDLLRCGRCWISVCRAVRAFSRAGRDRTGDCIRYHLYARLFGIRSIDAHLSRHR